MNSARWRARLRRPAIVVGCAAVGSLAAACGGAPSGSAGTPTSTTTLPVSYQVPGSGAGGSYPALGPVSRVLVSRVGRNQLAPRLEKDGTLPLTAVQIAYRQFGSGPNLLLLSGQHASMTSWDPAVLTELAAHFRVTEFDYPGVGYSQPDSRYQSVGSLADLTAGFIWSLGLSQPTVLGWGLGGSVALSLVERHPGLVWRLALAEATAGGSDATPAGAVVQSVIADPLATTIELSRVFFPLQAETQRIAWVSDIESVVGDSITSAAVVREQQFVANSLRSNEITAALPTVRIPVLLFVGGEDAVVPPANSTRIAEALPHARVVTFSDAGYAGIFQDSTTFLADLVSFTNR